MNSEPNPDSSCEISALENEATEEGPLSSKPIISRGASSDSLEKEAISEEKTAPFLVNIVSSHSDQEKQSARETIISQRTGPEVLKENSPKEHESGAEDSDSPSGPPSGISLAPGTVLGHFAVSKYIGGGGMGRVYLGIDKSLDRKVAIKVLQRQRAQDQFSVARFMNEARSAARLNHEHIAQVYYAGQQDDIPFIAFEYVEGTNIRTVVEEQGIFPLPQAITYLIQITHALEHAAFHGVVHRDVKPSNILITKEGRAKLIDMGLARLLKPSDPGDELTASGVTLGTFDYISPEQARDPRNADIRSDIYSLGCTLFYMLTGRPPFHEGTVLQKLLQHQGDEPPDIRAFLPGTPDEIAQLLQKMMAKDPRQRFQTPTSLLSELTGIAHQLGLRPSGPGNTVWTLRTPGKQSGVLVHLPWMVGLSLFFITFLFLSFYWNGDIEQIPIISPAETIGKVEEDPPSVSPADSSRSGGESKPPSTVWERISPKSSDPVQIDADYSRFLAGLSSGKGNEGKSRTSAQFTLIRNRFSAGAGIGRNHGSAFLVNSLDRPTFSSISLIPGRNHGVGSERNIGTTSTTLIVDPTNPRSSEGIFSTLSSAVAAAGKNTIIELRYNERGKESGRIEPLSLAGKHITIQAGKGFAPVLSFRPMDTYVVKNGRIYQFLINGGDVRFQNIIFEMDVSPNVFAEKWSIFEIAGSTRLSFQDCTFTITNALPGIHGVYNSGVYVFRTVSGSQSDLGTSPYSPLTAFSESKTTVDLNETSYGERSSNFLPLSSSGDSSFGLGSSPSGTSSSSPGSGSSALFSAENTTTIRDRGGFSGERDPVFSESPHSQTSLLSLKNCIIRGETGIIHAETNRPVKLEIENAFIAISLPFANMRETVVYPTLESLVSISLQHVSLYSESPLAQYIKGSNIYPLRTEWNCRYSVFRLNNKTPLTEFHGFRTPDEISTYFQWNGNQNFFQNLSTSFASIKASSSVTYPTLVSLADWKSRWNIEDSLESDIFSSSSLIENKSTSAMIPSDLSLSKRSDNPAVRCAPPIPESESGPLDAGQITNLLPRSIFRP